MSDTLIFDACQQLLDCVTEQLGDTAPERSHVIAGLPIVWDECCNGQLTVSVDTGYQTKEFPLIDTQAWPCNTANLGVTLLVQLLRCAPSSDDNGHPPPAAALEATARQAYVDALRIRRAMCRCFDSRDALIEPFDFTADGGCIAVEARVTALLLNPCGC